MARPNSMNPAGMAGGRGNAFENIMNLLQASGLKEKLLFTLVMVLIYRFVAHIPLWGVQPEVLASNPQAANVVGLLDMFSGGALGRLSIVGLGIGPYITSSIVLQLLTVVIPQLERLQKDEGEYGRRKIAQYTRYLTLFIAVFQSAMIIKFIVWQGGVHDWVNLPLFWVTGIITMTTGALFTLWLSELITAKGISNGASLLVFLGIISRLPWTFGQMGATAIGGSPMQSFMLLALIAVFIATIAFIVILQEAVRKIFIVSAKRQVGNKVYGGQSTHIPFKINPGGVMPIIFAFAVMAFPTALVSMLIQSKVKLGMFDPVVVFLGKYLSSGGWLYIGLEVLLLFFFSFFWASIMPNMQPRDIADNLKKQGCAIPGIKPGIPTSEFLGKILSKIIVIGACFLGVIALVPNSIEASLSHAAGVQLFRGLGTTSLIIMVGVALEVVNQIRVSLLVRQYEGFLKP